MVSPILPLESLLGGVVVMRLRKLVGHGPQPPPKLPYMGAPITGDPGVRCKTPHSSVPLGEGGSGQVRLERTLVLLVYGWQEDHSLGLESST